MPTSLQRDLKKKQRYLVQLTRASVGMHNVFGFVVDATEDLVLVHFFDSEAFCLTGYDVLRQRDIRSYCFFDEPRYWRFRALRRLKIRPKPPVGISLSSMPELLKSVSEHYPLLSVHNEQRNRHLTFVGRIARMRERSFTIADTSYYGEWTDPRRITYEDITRVSFDGGYLRAIAMTVQRAKAAK